MTHARTVNDIPILDFHVHFQVERGLAGPRPPENSAEISEGRQRRNAAVARYGARWRRSFDFPDPVFGERSLEEEADLWVAETEKYGIEKLVFVTSGGDDRAAQLWRRDPDRFIAFATSDDPFAPGAAEKFERAVVDGGLRGLKIIAPELGTRIDDRSAYPVWEVAERHGVPVLVHFGHVGSGGGTAHNDFIEPKHLEPVTKDFPGVDFVIPHFGVQHVQQLLFLSWASPNVYTDTSGSNQWISWMPYELTLKDLFRRFYETVGPERIIFGSDSSWFPRGYAYRYLADQLRIGIDLGWPEEHLRLVFGGNAARLLGVEWE